jgi:hypothetical protein
MTKRPTGKSNRLHPVSFKQFVDRLYSNPALKAEIIAELQGLGFCDFAEKHFKLIPRQKKELDTIRDKDSENVFTSAVVAILHRQGPIELIHEGHSPPNMMMEFYCRSGECLRISC